MTFSNPSQKEFSALPPARQTGWLTRLRPALKNGGKRAMAYLKALADVLTGRRNNLFF